MRRPHLGRAEGPHRLLPLLLRWCELLDPWARAAALEGVGHCVAQLPAPEVAWHAEFLLHRLRQVLVFREEAVLAALLPALFGAWEVLSPGFDPTAHAALASSLLDDLQRELVYVSDKPAARRSYFRALPALFPLLGLRLCTHLGGLLECCGQLLDIEVATAVAAVAGREGALAAALLPVRDALGLLYSLCRAAWPRAEAHALLVTRHVIAAHLRCATLPGTTLPAARDGDADGSRTVLPEAVRVLRLLDASGHCSEAVALLRNRPTTSRRAQAAVQALAEALARGTELD